MPIESGDYPGSLFAEPGPVRVPPDLKNAPAIVAMIGRFVSGKEYTPVEKVQLPAGKGFPAVNVSFAQLDRALRILSALIISFESKGYMTDVSAHSRIEETRVSKDGEEITFALEEQFRKTVRELSPEEKKKPPYLLRNLEQFLPSGRLRIKINTLYGDYEMWQDRKDDPLEGRINEVFAGIINSIESKIARRRKREEEHQIRELAARRREEEMQRRNDLERDASAWRKCEEIRAYLHAYGARLAEANNELDPAGEKARWLQWALGYADEIDPLNKIFGAD
ncbi:MAG: hypothetical protein WKF92_14870 [Pyrinomonadaceae bacterium]